jgi:maleylacetate reductase
MSLGENGVEAFQYTALPARVLLDSALLRRSPTSWSLWVARGPLFFPIRIMQWLPRRVSCALWATSASTFDAVMNTPVEVTERVLEKLVALNANCIVALGGGSTMGPRQGTGASYGPGADSASDHLCWL